MEEYLVFLKDLNVEHTIVVRRRIAFTVSILFCKYSMNCLGTIIIAEYLIDKKTNELD